MDRANSHTPSMISVRIVGTDRPASVAYPAAALNAQDRSKQISLQANQPIAVTPHPASYRKRDDCEQRHVQPRDRHEMRRAGRIEYPPLFARYATGIAHRQCRDECRGVAVDYSLLNVQVRFARATLLEARDPHR